MRATTITDLASGDVKRLTLVMETVQRRGGCADIPDQDQTRVCTGDISGDMAATCSSSADGRKQDEATDLDTTHGRRAGADVTHGDGPRGASPESDCRAHPAGDFVREATPGATIPRRGVAKAGVRVRGLPEEEFQRWGSRVRGARPQALRSRGTQDRESRVRGVWKRGLRSWGLRSWGLRIREVRVRRSQGRASWVRSVWERAFRSWGSRGQRFGAAAAVSGAGVSGAPAGRVRVVGFTAVTVLGLNVSGGGVRGQDAPSEGVWGERVTSGGALGERGPRDGAPGDEESPGESRHDVADDADPHAEVRGDGGAEAGRPVARSGDRMGRDPSKGLGARRAAPAGRPRLRLVPSPRADSDTFPSSSSLSPSSSPSPSLSPSLSPSPSPSARLWPARADQAAGVRVRDARVGARARDDVRTGSRRTDDERLEAPRRTNDQRARVRARGGEAVGRRRVAGDERSGVRVRDGAGGGGRRVAGDERAGLRVPDGDRAGGRRSAKEEGLWAPDGDHAGGRRTAKEERAGRRRTSKEERAGRRRAGEDGRVGGRRGERVSDGPYDQMADGGRPARGETPAGRGGDSAKSGGRPGVKARRRAWRASGQSRAAGLVDASRSGAEVYDLMAVRGVGGSRGRGGRRHAPVGGRGILPGRGSQDASGAAHAPGPGRARAGFGAAVTRRVLARDLGGEPRVHRTDRREPTLDRIDQRDRGGINQRDRRERGLGGGSSGECGVKGVVRWFGLDAGLSRCPVLGRTCWTSLTAVNVRAVCERDSPT